MTMPVAIISYLVLYLLSRSIFTGFAAYGGAFPLADSNKEQLMHIQHWFDREAGWVFIPGVGEFFGAILLLLISGSKALELLMLAPVALVREFRRKVG